MHSVASSPRDLEVHFTGVRSHLVVKVEEDPLPLLIVWLLLVIVTAASSSVIGLAHQVPQTQGQPAWSATHSESEDPSADAQAFGGTSVTLGAIRWEHRGGAARALHFLGDARTLRWLIF